MLSDVIVDGTTSVKDTVVANGDGSVSYTFSNVTSNHEITASFEVPNQAPTSASISVSSKTANSITFSLSGSDPDGDRLTYTVYVNGSNKGTPAGSTMKVSGLKEYTTYSYYVVAKDPAGLSKTSSVGSVTTYCSGTGYTCAPPATPCSTCAGWGNTSVSYSYTQETCSASGCYNSIVRWKCPCLGMVMDQCGGRCSPPVPVTIRDHTCQTVCTDCNGLINRDGYYYCEHGQTSAHNYCSHGYFEQHD